MKNENAISPVIGVILMVAITVILAAVIAVFVFSMADDIRKDQKFDDHITLFIKEKNFNEGEGFYVTSTNRRYFYINPDEQRTVQPMEFYDCEIRYDYEITNDFLWPVTSHYKRITNCKINETVTNV